MPDLSFCFESRADALSVQAYAWRCAGDSRGSVVIAHGAAEHALRYDRFARALNQAGFEVWAADHRGHARSAGPAGLGDAGPAGWPGLIDDMVQLIGRARAANAELPLALLGHSMGSFAAQELCLEHSREIDALILSGSTALDVPRSGEAAVPFEPNAAFEPARTPYDWLSRDELEVDRYIADPWCGFHKVPVTTLLAAMRAQRMANAGLLEQIRADLPVLLVAGEDDPLNRKLEGLRLLEKRWREAGVARIDCRYYPAARHELLNELNRDEVTLDLIAWLSSTLR